MKPVELVQDLDTVVWGNNEAGLWPYHVYGLCKTPDDTLIAMTEGRLEPSDTDPHHLVLKRSENAGESWGDSVYIEESLNGESWANMSLVSDYLRRRIWAIYALNYDNNSTRVFCRYSDDDGITWSSRREMTDLVSGKDENGWTFFFPGPTHGIQLTRQSDGSRNGRLVVSLWNRREIGASPRWYGVSSIYLDDPDPGDVFLGWRFGGSTVATTRATHGDEANVFHGMNEASVTELSDGRLLFHGRGANDTETARCRLYAYSMDGGTTIGDVRIRDDFSFTPCQAATVSHDGILFFSHPNAEDARADLTISMSYDDGETWEQHRRITRDGTMYSDMAIIWPDMLCVLHGSGRSSHRGFPHEVRFKRFRIKSY